MLSRLILVGILLSNAPYIASRPTGPTKDWEVGNSPLSGYDSASLWNHLAPWSSSGEESPYGAADSPFSPNTWFGLPPIAHPGTFDSHPQDPNGIQPHIVHHHDMPVPVPSVESSFQGFDLAHPTFHAGPSSQEHGPSGVSQHQDFPQAHFQEVSPSNEPSALPVALHRVPEINPVSSPPLSPRTRKLSGIRVSEGQRSPYEADWIKKDLALEGYRLSRMNRQRDRWEIHVFGGDEARKDLWRQRLQKVLGSKRLELVPASPAPGLSDKAYIAEDGYAVNDDHLTHGPAPKRGGGIHFLGTTGALKVQRVDSLDKGSFNKRVYVWWNNHLNMDHLNEKYFLNKLRFLPIDSKHLGASLLNRMHLGRKIQYVLPPVSEHGLPVIVDRHEGTQLGPMAPIAMLTKQKFPGHAISLWSPALYDGERYTMVLYGIAELDDDYRNEVLEHLRELQRERPNYAVSSSYNLADLAKAIH